MEKSSNKREQIQIQIQVQTRSIQLEKRLFPVSTGLNRLNGEIIEQAGTNVSLPVTLRLATRPPVGAIYRGRQGAAFISVPLAGC